LVQLTGYERHWEAHWLYAEHEAILGEPSRYQPIPAPAFRLPLFPKAFEQGMQLENAVIDNELVMRRESERRLTETVPSLRARSGG
jgi:hypothetical protein